MSCESQAQNLLDAFSSEKLLYMPSTTMINNRVTRKCVDAARRNATLVKEMGRYKGDGIRQ
jgi:hypothetical protein